LSLGVQGRVMKKQNSEKDCERQYPE
jgi:hypothetical protein